MDENRIIEVREALLKCSFKTRNGRGARVCYPNEILMELFGEEATNKNWIYERDEVRISKQNAKRSKNDA